LTVTLANNGAADQTKLSWDDGNGLTAGTASTLVENTITVTGLTAKTCYTFTYDMEGVGADLTEDACTCKFLQGLTAFRFFLDRML